MAYQPVVVVLSKFPDIFAGFRESVDRDAPELLKHVIFDNSPCPELDNNVWYGVSLNSPFHMARNANIVWKLSYTHDLVYCGDDVRFIEPDTIKRLTAIANSDPSIGIVAPRIKGQDDIHDGESETTPFVPFVCVYIKAEVIEKVGYLDESFEGYSWEDIDYCVRVRQAGFKIAYANQVWIQHGVDGNKWGSTFRRTIGQERIEKDMTRNLQHFAAKYGIEPVPQRVWDFVRELC